MKKLVIVFAVLALVGCGESESSSQKYIPDTVSGIVEVDIQGALNAEILKSFGDKKGGSNPASSKFEEEAKKLGLSTSAFIKAVIFGDKDMKEGGGLITVKGLDKEKAIASLKAEAKKKKQTISEVKHSAGTYYKNSGSGDCVFIKGGTVLIAKEAYLKKCLSAASSGNNISKNKALLNALASVKGKTISGAMVITKEMLKKNKGTPEYFKDAKSASLGINLGKTIDIQLSADLGKEKQAKMAIAELEKQLKAPGAKMFLSGPEGKKLLESIKPTAKGSTVSVSLSINKGVIEELMKGMLGMMFGGMMGDGPK